MGCQKRSLVTTAKGYVFAGPQPGKPVVYGDGDARRFGA
jgi:hypothetical protein